MSGRPSRAAIVAEKQAKERELEEYTQAFFKYSVLIQDHCDAMRHLPEEVNAAHAQMTKEHYERQKLAPRRELTIEELEDVLKYYGGLLEGAGEPQTVLDRVRICFYASYCIQIMVHEILSHRDRPSSDSLTVLSRGGQLLREHYSNQRSEVPTTAPAIVKFTPADQVTRPISQEDIDIWRSQPDDLVGKCFISTEMVRRVFLVDDYSVKKRKGAQYDVLYEDLGLDEVQTFDPATLLGMLSDGQAELVMNPLPRP